jgi:translation elongation factor P/translation initiation factor 5A
MSPRFDSLDDVPIYENDVIITDNGGETYHFTTPENFRQLEPLGYVRVLVEGA